MAERSIGTCSRRRRRRRGPAVARQRPSVLVPADVDVNRGAPSVAAVERVRPSRSSGRAPDAPELVVGRHRPRPVKPALREPGAFDDRVAMRPQARQRRVGVRGVRQHGRGARRERIARVRGDLSRAHAVDDRRDGSRVVVECGCCCDE